MKQFIQHLDQITEADQQLQTLAQEIDALADQMTEQDDSETEKVRRPRDRIEVFGRPRQR